MIKQFVTAFRTLSILPLPGKDTDNMAESIPFFSFIGFIIGVVFTGIYILFRMVMPELSLAGSIILVLTCTVLTGGIHLDGLGDVFDAFPGGRTKDDILRIMKDSRLGTFGVLAVLFDVLLKVSFTQYIFYYPELILVIPYSFIFSRTVQGFILIILPYAGDSGGTAYNFSAYASNRRACITVFTVTGFILWFAGAAYVSGCYFILSALACGTLSALVFVVICKRKIGGITGDCIGAANELFEIFFVFSCIILHLMKIF
jgi:adenosylcobinamide-GDP ribazoletransferase